MKTLTDFRKTVETGVDPHLINLVTLQFTFHLHVRSFIIRFKRNETLLDIS